MHRTRQFRVRVAHEYTIAPRATVRTTLGQLSCPHENGKLIAKVDQRAIILDSKETDGNFAAHIEAENMWPAQIDRVGQPQLVGCHVSQSISGSHNTKIHRPLITDVWRGKVTADRHDLLSCLICPECVNSAATSDWSLSGRTRSERPRPKAKPSEPPIHIWLVAGQQDLELSCRLRWGAGEAITRWAPGGAFSATRPQVLLRCELKYAPLLGRALDAEKLPSA